MSLQEPKGPTKVSTEHFSPLRGLYGGIIWGTLIGVIKGDTRSLDYGVAGMSKQKVSGDLQHAVNRISLSLSLLKPYYS